MISHRYHGSTRLFFVFKQVVGYALFWLSLLLLHWFVYKNELNPSNYIGLSMVVPIAAYIEKMVRAANRQSLCGLNKEKVTNITQREIIFSMVAVFGVIVMTKNMIPSRVFLALFFASYACWVTWMNFEGHRLLQRLLYRNQEKGKTKTIVLASQKEVDQDRALQMSSHLPGSDVLGYVLFGGEVAGATGSGGASLPLLGEFSNLSQICRETKARMLLTAGIEDRPGLVQSLQQMCDSMGMRLVWVDDKAEKFKGNLDVIQHGNQVYLTKWSEPLEEPFARVWKRVFDIVFASTVLVTIYPLLYTIVWVLQKLYSPLGPVIYKQERTGRNGEVFEVLKFRTMHLNGEAQKQATRGDARIYKGGDFLRRASLDEIPQFFNVFKGEMSVVGPRPHYINHDEEFKEIVDDYAVRFFAKPGVTGLAQVKGCRGETDSDKSVRQRVRLDNFYLRNWSPWLDFKIIFLTMAHLVFPPDSAR